MPTTEQSLSEAKLGKTAPNQNGYRLTPDKGNWASDQTDGTRVNPVAHQDTSTPHKVQSERLESRQAEV